MIGCAPSKLVDSHRVRFRLKQPWPDFMTFYGTPATGAGWIVPRKYVEKVGDDAFKKAPVGAGPYKFVSFTPGVELVLEANEQYWRKVPSVKRLVFKSVVDEGFWQPPAPTYDLQKAKQLLAEAGYPNGLDAGDYYCDASYANLGEAVVNYLRAAGIRSQLRPLERAAFIAQNSQKKLKNIIQTASGAFGSAATRLDSFVAAAGTFTYGSYSDIEGLIGELGSERDPKKREAALHRIQQLIHDKAMYAPIWELAFLNGHGPRVAESGLTLIASHPYSSPYEDLKLKGK